MLACKSYLTLRKHCQSTLVHTKRQSKRCLAVWVGFCTFVLVLQRCEIAAVFFVRGRSICIRRKGGSVMSNRHNVLPT